MFTYFIFCRYGGSDRKVLAHMPHLLDRKVLAQMMAAFPQEFDINIIPQVQVLSLPSFLLPEFPYKPARASPHRFRLLAFQLLLDTEVHLAAWLDRLCTTHGPCLSD